MTDLYSRLYRYKQDERRDTLEDFLTEAFADLFGRFAPEDRRALLETLLPAGAIAGLAAAVPDFGELEMLTQVAIGIDDRVKRPDMVLVRGRRSLLAIEAKVGAVIQSHTFGPASADGDGPLVRNQLETYAEWIGRENDGLDGWPGAVVFLTARTEPPDDFRRPRANGLVTGVATWGGVGRWLDETFAAADQGSAPAALARDLSAFIEREGLMTNYPTSRDLAAAALFARSYRPVEALVDDTIKAVSLHVPKLSAGRQLRNGFLSDLDIFWGWFLFSRAIRRLPTVPCLAFGVCFEMPEAWQNDRTRHCRHEPFFLMLCEDDREKERIATILHGVPEGWILVDDGWSAIVCRPVSAFPADPDKRAAALQEWAKHEADRLVLCVPGYEAAPAGPVAVKKTADDD